MAHLAHDSLIPISCSFICILFVDRNTEVDGEWGPPKMSTCTIFRLNYDQKIGKYAHNRNKPLYPQ